MRPMIFLLHHAPLVIPSVSPSGLFMPAEKFYSCFMETSGNIFNNYLDNQHFMFCSVSGFPENWHQNGTFFPPWRRFGKHFVPLPAQKSA